jgi:predicted protein tyrosine phosphatase
MIQLRFLGLSTSRHKAKPKDRIMKRILFVCGQNKLRSPTAESVFSSNPEWEVRSAGLKNNSDVQIGIEDVEWAEYIFVMEKSHKRKLQDRFSAVLNHQRVICLGIADDYPYMDAKLVAILEQKVPRLVN